MMRKPSDKSDSVGQQYALSARQSKLARRWIKSRKQLILGKYPRVGQTIKQGGFPRVGVSDNSNPRKTAALTRRTCGAPGVFNRVKLLLQCRNTP